MPLDGDRRFQQLLEDMAQTQIDWAREHPVNTPELLFMVASAHYLRGEFDEAIATYQRALDLTRNRYAAGVASALVMWTLLGLMAWQMQVRPVFRRHGFFAGRVAPDRARLAEIEADHVRNVRVGGLVIRHAGADRVGQGDVAGPVGLHQAGHAQVGVGAQLERVAVVIVEAAQQAVQDARGTEEMGGQRLPSVIQEALQTLQVIGHRHQVILQVGRQQQRYFGLHGLRLIVAGGFVR